MILVHHLENSRSQRILWLLEELELEYDVKRYERNRRTMLAPASLTSVHPLGKSPAVEIDGLVLTESGAIVEYLVGRQGGLLAPVTPADSLLFRQFIHYAEGSLMPPLLTMLVLRKMGPFGLPARPRVQAMLDAHLDWLEAEMSQRAWFAGSAFSAADVMMSFPLELSRARAGLGKERPALLGWLSRIHDRPAYRRALSRGGPYLYSQ